MPGCVLTCCGGGFRAHGGERLDIAALEADVNLGRSFSRQLDEGDILDDVGKQPLAFAVRRVRIAQSFLKSAVIATSRSWTASSRMT